MTVLSAMPSSSSFCEHDAHGLIELFHHPRIDWDCPVSAGHLSGGRKGSAPPLYLSPSFSLLPDIFCRGIRLSE